MSYFSDFKDLATFRFASIAADKTNVAAAGGSDS